MIFFFEMFNCHAIFWSESLIVRFFCIFQPHLYQFYCRTHLKTSVKPCDCIIIFLLLSEPRRNALAKISTSLNLSVIFLLFFHNSSNSLKKLRFASMFSGKHSSHLYLRNSSIMDSSCSLSNGFSLYFLEHCCAEMNPSHGRSLPYFSAL